MRSERLRFGDIANLSSHIEFAQAVCLSFRVVNARDLLVILAVNILDVGQPILNLAMIFVLHRRPDAPASVMPGHDDMPHVEDLDRELDDCQAVQIAVRDDIGNIAMHEHLTGL